MPATPEELAALEAVGDEVALDAVSTVTVDGQSVTAIDLRHLRDWIAWRKGQAALDDAANPNGGAKSAWNRLRPARFSPIGPGQ